MLEQQIEHPGGLLPLAFGRRRGIVVLALQNGSACDGLLESLEYQLALHDPAVVRQGAVKPRIQRAQTGDALLPVFTGEGAKKIQSLSGEQHRSSSRWSNRGTGISPHPLTAGALFFPCV